MKADSSNASALWCTCILTWFLCWDGTDAGTQFCEVFLREKISVTMLIAGGRRDPDAQLDRAVGDALKQASAAASGAGALVWDLLADYYHATGFPASACEAALKQVRQHQWQSLLMLSCRRPLLPPSFERPDSNHCSTCIIMPSGKPFGIGEPCLC